MKIIDHGVWHRYEPVPRFADLPSNIMFCRRDGDGKDWYEYLKGNELTQTSLKMTVLDDVVRAASRDASMLFPQGCRVIEVVGDDASDPQTRYGGMVYDAKARVLAAKPAEPKPSPQPTVAELMARIDALERRLRQ
jgi:hypothetical protein